MKSDENADFEDDRGMLSKEARVRRHTLRIYNRRREEFSSDREYEDYLEHVEDIIYNLTFDIDVDATKAEVEKYRKENQDRIGQNQTILDEAERRSRELLDHEDRQRRSRLAELRAQDAKEEHERREQRRKEEEEAVQRIALGEEEFERRRQKKLRREERQRKKAEKISSAVAAQKAAAEAPNIQPQFFRPAFPNPQPQPLLGDANLAQKAEGGRNKAVTPEEARVTASAGGYVDSIPRERARIEVEQSLSVLAR